jgi:hypothetical protein
MAGVPPKLPLPFGNLKCVLWAAWSAYQAREGIESRFLHPGRAVLSLKQEEEVWEEEFYRPGAKVFLSGVLT